MKYTYEQVQRFLEKHSCQTLETIINSQIVGTNAERNRRILYRRLADGITYEKLAEEFDMSASQIKRIIRKGMEKIIN